MSTTPEQIKNSLEEFAELTGFSIDCIIINPDCFDITFDIEIKGIIIRNIECGFDGKNYSFSMPSILNMTNFSTRRIVQFETIEWKNIRELLTEFIAKEKWLEKYFKDNWEYQKGL